MKNRVPSAVEREVNMAVITWTADFSVGVESLDTDHKVLISLLNHLEEAIIRGEPREAIRRVLDALLDYTDYHFEREEMLMAASRYPDLDAHKQTHRMLRAQVVDIRDRYLRSPEAIHSREILAFLKNWLTAHIMGRDKLYGPFMISASDAILDAERSFTAEISQPTAAAIAAPEYAPK